jgi:gliding motility-associated-like protein
VGLTAVSDSGCSSTLSELNLITVYTHPNAAFTMSPNPATIIAPTVQFTDQSTDAYGIAYWWWTFGEAGDTTSNLQNPTHTYQDTGTYCAQEVVMNIHGCTDTVTNCLEVNPVFNLYIPSAFSPNGDGKNDVFRPVGQYIKNYEMYIFDRWGMELFHTLDIANGWDGSVKGGSTVSQEDTYVYKINVTDSQNKQHSFIGNVTIIK